MLGRSSARTTAPSSRARRAGVLTFTGAGTDDLTFTNVRFALEDDRPDPGWCAVLGGAAGPLFRAATPSCRAVVGRLSLGGEGGRGGFVFCFGGYWGGGGCGDGGVWVRCVLREEGVCWSWSGRGRIRGCVWEGLVSHGGWGRLGNLALDRMLGDLSVCVPTFGE